MSRETLKGRESERRGNRIWFTRSLKSRSGTVPAVPECSTSGRGKAGVAATPPADPAPGAARPAGADSTVRGAGPQHSPDLSKCKRHSQPGDSVRVVLFTFLIPSSGANPYVDTEDNFTWTVTRSDRV